MSFHARADTPAWDHVELLNFLRHSFPVFPKRPDDGLAKGMFREQFGSGGKTVQFVVLKIVRETLHSHHTRCTRGQGACFVKSAAAYLRQSFQSVSLTHKKAVSRGIADGGHDGRGRGEYQGAGAENNKDGDGAYDFACHKPCQGSRGQGDDHNPSGPAVG